MALRITDKISEIDLARVQLFLKGTVWQSGIGPKTLGRALNNSLCISAFDDNLQIGFARAVTDRATSCWIDDVFVDPAHRGQGVAGRMIESIVQHSELRSVASWFLSSSNQEARRVFAKYGFESIGPERAGKLMARAKIHNEQYST